MKRLTFLFVAALAMVFSSAMANTMVAKKAIGKGKMKASISAAYKMVMPKEGDSKHMIDVAQLGAYSFLSPQSAGLSFGYGINDEIHVALSLPVFTMMSQGDASANTMFGKPSLAFVYAKNVGKYDLTVAPYLSLPFMEMYGGDADGDVNFDQPMSFGLNLAFDSAMPGKVFWGLWMNMLYTLEKDGEDHKFMWNITALVGYKLGNGQMVKLQLYYDMEDIMKDKHAFKGLMKAKVVYGKKLNKMSGIHAGLMYGTGLEGSKLYEKHMLGVILDYWVKF